MTPNPVLAELLHTLDSNQGCFARLRQYATGTQPLAFLTADQRKALDHRLARMSINVPALVTSAICERLRIVSYSDPRAWNLFVANDLDQLAADTMNDALTYGTGYVLVWAKDGKPVASVESPFECAVLRDPADRSVIAGVKRFQSKTDTHAYVYLPDRVQHWVAPRTGPALSGYVLVDTVQHHLGTVPLVPIDNGRSEIDDVLPLVDSLVHVTLSMVIASHAAGFGRRWVTGADLIEAPRLDDDGNPVLDDNDDPIIDTTTPFDEQATLPWAIAENEQTRFGSFNEPTLSGFHVAIQTLVSMIQAVSALPSHYLGVLTNQPTSADALRASEASLTARAESKQLRFGRAWEQVGRLLVAVDTGANPGDIPLRVQWADAATRSEAQAADAAVKYYQAGLLDRGSVLARLGYSADEISVIESALSNDTTPPTNGA
jgi:hypothetical protein